MRYCAGMRTSGVANHLSLSNCMVAAIPLDPRPFTHTTPMLGIPTCKDLVIPPPPIPARVVVLSGACPIPCILVSRVCVSSFMTGMAESNVPSLSQPNDSALHMNGYPPRPVGWFCALISLGLE